MWLKKLFFSKKVDTLENTKTQNEGIQNKTPLGRLQSLKLAKSHQDIILEFGQSPEYKKYRQEIQQGLIDEWLKEKCENQSHRRVLKEIINNCYLIKTSRKESSLLTIC